VATVVATDVAPEKRRGFWAQPNIVYALVGFVVGFLLVNNVIGGTFANPRGPFITGAPGSPVTNYVNAQMLLAYLVGIFGYFLGLGYLNYPIQWLMGREPSQNQLLYEYGAGEGWTRYFRLTLDHKVVGVQYFITVIAFFCIAGWEAMMIRFQLWTPRDYLVSPQTYLTLVGEHSVLMLMVASSAIIGPFGNYFIPLMIGARRMAYPRIEALAYWLFLLSGFAILSAYLFGGFPTGWTGYAPLSDQAHTGMNAYLIAFALTGFSFVASGINILATVFHLRAPGMTWTRLPMTVWSIVVASILAWLAAPILLSVLTMVAFDRSFLTGFFIPVQGGSAFLYENLFWTFGHPEVYILAVPAFGIVLDIVAVFARRPVYAYKASVVAMFGIGLLSWFVWQHHLFVSGLTPSLRPFFMFSTEMISFPTGIIFLSGLGTLFGGRIRFTVPMLFALAFFPNFLLGGFSGVFLSDVPADIQLHGSYFVQAHFHFVLMGGTFFALFAATYYWFPKLTGKTMNETLGQLHFWTMWLGFNGTFISLAIVGMLGMPRRAATYSAYLQTTNQIASLFAFLLGASILPFLANVVYTWAFAEKIAEANPWRSRSLEWMTATPVPIDNFEEIPRVVAGPYDYGVPDAPAIAILKPSETATGVAMTGH
jgi:cytochrome c oxidase subunit 1